MNPTEYTLTRKALQEKEGVIMRVVKERDAALAEVAKLKTEEARLREAQRVSWCEQREAYHALEGELAKLKEERDEQKRVLDDYADYRDACEDRIDSLRQELAEARETIKRAKTLVVLHHDASIQQSAGCFCPVCSSDGTDKEFDAVFNRPSNVPPVAAPEEWRMLEVGEVIQEGDEALQNYLTNKWLPASCVGCTVEPEDVGHFRRRITEGRC